MRPARKLEAHARRFVGFASPAPSGGEPAGLASIVASQLDVGREIGAFLAGERIRQSIGSGPRPSEKSYTAQACPDLVQCAAADILGLIAVSDDPYGSTD
jgi:hypothetical protein